MNTNTEQLVLPGFPTHESPPDKSPPIDLCIWCNGQGCVECRAGVGRTATPPKGEQREQ